MAVPKTYDLVLPLLEIIKDKDEYKVKEVIGEVIDYIDLPEEDMEIKLPNNEPLINSRISTANTYLKKAELIESNRFMYFNITEEGLNVLSQNPDKITEDDLMEYPGFKEYKKVFGKAGMLTADNLNKISELAENNPDFIDTIPETIKKLKRVEFDGLRYNAKTLCWLFDEDHYEKVYSGAWDFETREEVVERLRQRELEERRKKQNELANSNGFG